MVEQRLVLAAMARHEAAIRTLNMICSNPTPRLARVLEVGIIAPTATTCEAHRFTTFMQPPPGMSRNQGALCACVTFRSEKATCRAWEMVNGAPRAVVATGHAMAFTARHVPSNCQPLPEGQSPFAHISPVRLECKCYEVTTTDQGVKEPNP